MDIDLFQQEPPALGNQYDDDRVLRSYLKRVLPDDVLQDAREQLREMGALSGGALYDLQRADREHEPTLTQWDAWGNRIDEIEVTALWKEAERIAAHHGLIATAYEQQYERYSRVLQFALVYLFTPSSDIYSCPLAMTDGAARTLLASGNQDLIDRAVSRLASRHLDRFWTSGQWMTELPGGSDVGRTETVARQDDDGTWRLYGRKWFTSAVSSQMALALARPEGNPEGSKGLALFYVELRDDEGRLQNIRVHRLKDKLGTRKLPTAELTLDGTPATPVAGLEGGVRHIAPMLNITRTWNAVSAVALMRRGLALARDYARKREAFGAPLAEKPLHVDTLAGLQATYEGAFHLTFRIIELIGRLEAGGLDEQQRALVEMLLRALTSVTKLTTAKQAVAVTSEVLEAFGGAGYVEDTGLPVLLRDAQVLTIWEGTTNVLALDLLRALQQAGGLAIIKAEVQRCAAAVTAPSLADPIDTTQTWIDQAEAWMNDASARGRDALEAGARRFALTLGRTLELALLTRHAQWALDQEGDQRPAAAARRFATGSAPTAAVDVDASYALANDTPLPLPPKTGTDGAVESAELSVPDAE